MIFFLESSFPKIELYNDTLFQAWINTTYKRNYPNSSDSATRQLNIAYSTNYGRNWVYSEESIVHEESGRVSNENRPNLRFELENLHLKKINNELYLIYTSKDSFTGSSAELIVSKWNDNKIEPLIRKSFENYSFIGNLDIHLLNSNVISMVLTAFDTSTSIRYIEINIINNEIIKDSKISNLWFKGGSNIPLSIIDDISGLNPSTFNPTPKLASCASDLYCVWSATGTIEPEFDLDIYFSRSLDGGLNWESPLKLNSIDEGEQFFPCISCTGNDYSFNYLV